jgi:cytochrome c oxidase assembly factor CtaG
MLSQDSVGSSYTFGLCPQARLRCVGRGTRQGRARQGMRIANRPLRTSFSLAGPGRGRWNCRRLLSLAGLVCVGILLFPHQAAAHGTLRPPAKGLWRVWSVQPALFTLLVVAALLFGRAFLRLRARGRSDHAGSARAALFVLALLLVVLALMSPLDVIGDDYLISAHMLQHVLIGDVVPALLLVSLRGPLLLFALPVTLLRALAGRSWIRRGLGFVLRPRVALAIWAAVFAAWHVPALYDAALRHAHVHELEHASFLLAGVLVWAPLIDPLRRRALTDTGRYRYAASLFACAFALSVVLIASPPLYPAYAHNPLRLFGLSASGDQHVAGLAMLLEQAGALALCCTLIARASHRRAGGRRADRRAREPALSASPSPAEVTRP